MKQHRDKNGRFTKVSRVTGERNLVDSDGNFSSERSNFNISKVDSGSNTFLYCLCLILILALNICFIINCNKRIAEFKEYITLENLKFQQEIEQMVDIQNKIISNYN